MSIPRRRTVSGLVPILGLLALAPAACDWALVDPDRRHYSDRAIEGRYEGTFVLEWETYDRRGRRGRDGGRGSIRIDRAYGSTFEGEWSWRLDGRWLEGDLERGREDFLGDVSFSLEPRFRGTRFGSDLLEELTGCHFVSGDRRFHGSFGRAVLRADRRARLRCRDPFGGRSEDLLVRVSFSGRRSGYRY